MGRFKKGDIVRPVHTHDVYREIVKVRRKSYLWKYPDLPDSDSNLFDSRNSNDPEMYYWEILFG